MFKICRKTFGSYIAQKKGIEIAARKLNHSSTKVTRDHYIVPEDDELKIDDIYESNVEQLKKACLLYTSPSPRDRLLSRMPSSA